MGLLTHHIFGENENKTKRRNDGDGGHKTEGEKTTEAEAVASSLEN